MKDKPQIDLNKYRSHQRKIPWVLIRKIVIVSIIIGLLYFFKDVMKGEKVKVVNPQDDIEVEIEL